MKLKSITALLAGTIFIGAIPAIEAEAKDEPVVPQRRDTYVFKRTMPTNELKPYSATAYSSDARNVRTMRGDALFQTKDSVIAFDINPAGVNFAVVTKGKKGNKMSVNSTMEIDAEVFKFNAKKYGQPTAVAYMPDARMMVVAAGGKAYFLETRKYQPVYTIDGIPAEVDRMTVSPNGYFLALTDGGADGKVRVYNIEEKSLRKELSMGEKVNDIEFSPASDDFGVLTADGVLTLYNTRSFDMRKMIDDLGEGIAFEFNFDGKYAGVVINPNNIAVVNLLRDSEREYYNEEIGGTSDITFMLDSEDNTMMAYPRTGKIEARRMYNLKPFYNRLIADEVDKKMDEWLKMMPGETMDEYKARVTEETRARQRRLFEDEISTNLAGDMLAGATMSLGSYDRANGVLAINFDSMPTIYLPVPESDVTSFKDAGDLKLSDVQYGIMPDDTFEIVYAKVTNSADGKTYVYDNLQRAEMNYMAADDAISLELLQQQQMEAIQLEELREKVVAEAKNMNVISDHTNIAVDSKVVPDFDANGKKILNYQVSFTYNVEPEFSAVEDFGPGKYHVEESGAASSMLKIVKEAFEGDFKQYLESGKKLRISLKGTADATPIVRGIAYDGAYGEFENEPVYKDGQLSTISVNKKDGIKENDQLALIRAMGVKDYLEKNVEGLKDMNTDYRYEVNVSKDKGSEHRRINVDFIFVDAY